MKCYFPPFGCRPLSSITDFQAHRGQFRPVGLLPISLGAGAQGSTSQYIRVILGLLNDSPLFLALAHMILARDLAL